MLPNIAAKCYALSLQAFHNINDAFDRLWEGIRENKVPLEKEFSMSAPDSNP